MCSVRTDWKPHDNVCTDTISDAAAVCPPVLKCPCQTMVLSTRVGERRVWHSKHKRAREKKARMRER